MLELLIAPVHFRNLLTHDESDAEFVNQLATYVIRALQPDTNPHDEDVQG